MKRVLEESFANLPSGYMLTDQLQIVSGLGRGGTSTVYKALNVALDTIVAVKIIDRAVIDETAFGRMQREAQALAALHHPNILKVHSLQLINQRQTCIVMEHFDGMDLSAFLAERKITLECFMQIFYRVCDALAYAHAKGFVHRDIKPSNIMVATNSDGSVVVKLIDFGIAKCFASEQKLTQTGALLGTPAYMSPEQLCSGQIDCRTDIYSLGCVMYQAISGKQPFNGETLFELAQQHLVADIPPITDPRFKQFQPLLLKCMAKSSADRFQSMNELVAALHAPESVALSVSPQARPVPRPAQRPNAVAIVAVIATTLLTLVTFALQPYIKSRNSPKLSITEAYDRVIAGNAVDQSQLDGLDAEVGSGGNSVIGDLLHLAAIDAITHNQMQLQAHCKRCVRNRANNPDFEETGRSIASKGNHAAAAVFLATAAAEKRFFVGARRDAGYLYAGAGDHAFSAGNTQEAIRMAQFEKQMDVGVPGFFLQKGSVDEVKYRIAMDRPEKALKAVNNAIKGAQEANWSKTRIAQLFELKGNVFYHLAKFDEAAQAYRQGIKFASAGLEELDQAALDDAARLKMGLERTLKGLPQPKDDKQLKS